MRPVLGACFRTRLEDEGEEELEEVAVEVEEGECEDASGSGGR